MTGRLRAALSAAALALLVLAALVGCGSTNLPAAPGDARIDVDTPALAAMKKDAGVEDCAPGDAAPVDGGLPEVTLPCFGGGPDVDLAALRGPMVINLFASWCGPCRKEMPVLQQFHERYGDRVRVVGVDYTDSQTVPAMELVQRSGVTYPLLADPQSDLQGAAPFPNRMGVPLFAFVAGDGTVSIATGGVTSLVDLVDQHLGTDL
jgi:thiol-disulfide isomerase/thioredoxin